MLVRFNVKEVKEFFGFCEDANYHSFDSYSMLEQFDICKDYDRVDE